MTHLKVDVWSDIACPWCYVGAHSLDAAVRSFAAAAPAGTRDVDVEFHSFQLAPHLPLGPTQTINHYNTKQLMMDETDARAALAHVTRRARAVGIELDFETTRVTNTLLAHQLIHHAKTHGLQRQAKEALFIAYFTQGRNVSNVDDLADIGLGIGLDRDQVVDVLTRQHYVGAVDADLDRARSYGIRSVPFFVFDNTYAVAGAQGADALERALERAWSDKEEVA